MSGPTKSQSFKDTFLELYETFDRTGLKILAAIARYLKIDEDYFIDTVRDGNSVLRLLHYPPIVEPSRQQVRAGAHEDINTITLLLGAEEAGLELLTRDGRWIPVSPKPGRAGGQHRRHAAAADQRRAALDHAPGRQPAARARAASSRYSMPFFLHFRSDFLIEALPGTVPRRRAAEMSRRSPPTTTSRSGCARSS